MRRMTCPKCKADLTGDPIPGKAVEFYSRVIGIDINDRIAFWKCPECGHEELRGNLSAFEEPTK